MAIKAFIATSSASMSQLMQAACEEACTSKGISTFLLQDESRLLEEIGELQPEIVFLHAILIEMVSGNIIAQIKEGADLGHPRVVVCAQRSEWADVANQMGADGFLPLPFSTEQIAAVLREVLDAPRTVLIVSAAEAHLILRDDLSALGREATLSRTGAEGLALAERDVPDILIVDWELGDMTGLEFCERIRRSRTTGHIPVLVLTPDADVETMERCFETGAHDILLPPFDARDIAPRISAVVASPQSRRQDRVLLVDDSLLVRNLVAGMLRQVGMIACSAASGMDGLELAQSEPPDLIVCDIHMPAMDGWEFCAKLRQTAATQDIPVLLISSAITDEVRARGKDLGVSGYLLKPFKAAALQEAVLRILGAR